MLRNLLADTWWNHTRWQTLKHTIQWITVVALNDIEECLANDWIIVMFGLVKVWFVFALLIWFGLTMIGNTIETYSNPRNKRTPKLVLLVYLDYCCSSGPPRLSLSALHIHTMVSHNIYQATNKTSTKRERNTKTNAVIMNLKWSLHIAIIIGVPGLIMWYLK